MHRLALPVQHASLLAAVLPMAGWALHSTHLRRRLDAARRDPLTGLVTRPAFEAAAQRALRHPNRSTNAIAFVDLDRFKALNDAHGHAAGDCALIHAAVSLSLLAGVSGTAARLGGDEFALVLPTTDLDTRLAYLTTRLAGFTWAGQELPLSASVGICPIADLPHPTLTTALAAADAAMYQAKSRGGGWTLAQPTTDPEPRRWARTGPTTHAEAS
jgi:diguanylate cyclase (GGDEF)-like protein